MGTRLLKWARVWNVEVRVKIYSCGCKQVRGGKSYSSVRTHYNTKNEYAQRLLWAYREQGKDRMDLY